MPTCPPALEPLREALQRRVEIIADHAWRDRDAAGHLHALQSISEAIFTLQANTTNLPPQLQHFLESQSYQKALAMLGGLKQ